MMRISKYNEWAGDDATVDIERMPLEVAKQLVEALTVIKETTGDMYRDVVDFREKLLSAIQQ